MAKQLVFNVDARAALKRGVDRVAEAVKITLGPNATPEQIAAAGEKVFSGVGGCGVPYPPHSRGDLLDTGKIRRRGSGVTHVRDVRAVAHHI